MDALHFFNQGIEKFRNRDYLGAIQDYTAAIKLSSGVTPETNTEKHSDGSVSHIKVFNISEGFGEIYFNRGLAYMDIGMYVEALEDFTKVIAYASKDAEVYFKRAIVNYCLENDNEMEEDLKMAFSLDSKYTHEFFQKQFQS